MTINQLKYVVAVADTHHFAKAGIVAAISESVIECLPADIEVNNKRSKHIDPPLG